MNTELIVKELKQQNRKVFKKVFSDYYEDLVIYANGYLFDKDSSEDVVQEVFIYLWENASRMDIKISLKAYLYKMVRNRCLKYLKSLKITDNSNFIELSASLSGDNSIDSFSLDEKKIIYNQVLKIVDTLPLKMQQVFRLKFLSNYKYSEIADEMGISVNTVKTQLKRAKLKINELIAALIILLSTYN